MPRASSTAGAYARAVARALARASRRSGPGSSTSSGMVSKCWRRDPHGACSRVTPARSAPQRSSSPPMRSTRELSMPMRRAAAHKAGRPPTSRRPTMLASQAWTSKVYRFRRAHCCASPRGYSTRGSACKLKAPVQSKFPACLARILGCIFHEVFLFPAWPTGVSSSRPQPASFTLDLRALTPPVRVL